MRAAPDASLHAPPAVNAARVVFVRERIHPPDEPHGIAANPSPVHVIDERGELVGDLAPGTWFAGPILRQLPSVRGSMKHVPSSTSGSSRCCGWRMASWARRPTVSEAETVCRYSVGQYRSGVSLWKTSSYSLSSA